MSDVDAFSARNGMHSMVFNGARSDMQEQYSVQGTSMHSVKGTVGGARGSGFCFDSPTTLIHILK